MPFSFYRTLTVTSNSALLPSTQSNFAVLVKISDATLKLTPTGHINNSGAAASGPAVTMPYDLIFTSDLAGTTKIPWEVESYDGTNGILWAWVFLSSCALSTVFYCFYGDSSLNSAQNLTSFTPANVWDSNFKLVAHLADPTSATILRDSTSIGNTITNHSATAATGQINGGAATTASQYISVPVNLSATNKITIETWFFKATYTNTDLLLMEFTANGAVNSGGFGIDPNSGGGTFEIYATGNAGTADITFTRPSAAVWHHLAVTIDFSLASSEIANVYIDGVAQTLTRPLNPDNSVNFANSTLYLMCRNGASLFTPGTLDEVRISASIRGADWIKAEYNNQNDPTTFITVGAEISLSSITNQQISLLGCGS